MGKQRHLVRLTEVWREQPIYYITVCTIDRRRELATDPMHDICCEVWRNCESLYSWFVGRYVVMRDRAHFFCASTDERQPLSLFIAKWKEWTSKYARERIGLVAPLWQREFFDHLMRSDESYEQKSHYDWQNPVRARLVTSAGCWPYAGEMNALRMD